jgi:hypothetical protein
MIELTYFNDDVASKAYQLIQFRAGEPWRVVDEGELLGSIEKLDGRWLVRGKGVISESLIQGISGLIDRQHFNRLPVEIKAHWTEEVQEAIAQGDNQYLVICKVNIDFQRFEKVFSAYISTLVKDEWDIRFRVYDADMSCDFEVFVKKNELR